MQPVPSVAPEIRARILAELDAITQREGVQILFAIESGSRAWGFPSPDSDYDVRFVYAHSADWYLTIAPGRNVIELPFQDALDINGWDIRKTWGFYSSPIQSHSNGSRAPFVTSGATMCASH